jgi:hypothetical protein
MRKTAVLFFVSVMAATAIHAQLMVTVAPPKIVGQKAVVPLALKNSLPEKIESARAVVFLIDEQGKIAGQASQWVIGGMKDRPALAAGATNAFYFTISSDRPFQTTNLTAKVSFTRVVLEGGKLADMSKHVIVTPAAR